MRVPARKGGYLEAVGFFDSVLHPLMAQASKGDIVLLFMDASHFVMGCDFLGYIYSKGTVKK